jgi:prevent-host-death family protein
MGTATTFEARNHFSKMLKRVQDGETITITSGREKKVVAKLVPAEEVKPKRLGFMLTPDFELTDAFWEPMSDEECGIADRDDDPLCG